MKRMISFCCFFIIIGFGQTWAKNDRVEKENMNKITVTAQKLEENLKDIPMSISGFNSVIIEDRNIQNIKELSRYVPSFFMPEMGDWGVNATSIRGISSDLTTMTSSTGFYVDGVPSSNSVGFLALLEDVERVEVLRGPQGALYGKNSEAGVVNIVTKKPTNSFEGKFNVELGEDNKREIGLSLRGPIVKDKFFLGVTGRFYSKDGFMENTYFNNTINDRENYFGKIFARYEANDRLDISFISSKYIADNGTLSQNIISASDPDNIESDLNGFVKFDIKSHSFRVKYEFDYFNIESVTCYKEMEQDTLLDNDFSSSFLFHPRANIPYKTVSEEFKLSGKIKRLRWVAGLYADKNEKTGGYKFLSPLPGNEMIFNSDLDEKTIGLFGHLDYKITDKFSLILGLRYDEDYKEIKDYGANIEADEDYSELSPKVALKYQLDSNFMAYASATKGYKSGGFYTFAAPGYPVAFDKETLWNYEIGIKSSLFDDKLALNASAYYMKISDMQVLSQVDLQYGYISNAGSATSKGFEIESSLSLSKNLSFFANLGVNETVYDKFSDFVDNYEDKYNPYSPKCTYAAGLKYRSVMGLFVSTDITGYGKMYLDKANEFEQDSYFLVNAKLGYEMDSFDIYFYGKNILDEEYNAVGAYNRYVMLSDPGEFGIHMTYRF